MCDNFASQPVGFFQSIHRHSAILTDHFFKSIQRHRIAGTPIPLSCFGSYVSHASAVEYDLLQSRSVRRGFTNQHALCNADTGNSEHYPANGRKPFESWMGQSVSIKTDELRRFFELSHGRHHKRPLVEKKESADIWECESSSVNARLFQMPVYEKCSDGNDSIQIA